MDSGNLCLDTDVLIFFLKGREPIATAVAQAVRNYTCMVTAITTYELFFGVSRASREIGEQDLLGMMKILPFDSHAAHRAAQLHDSLIRQNQDIGIKDVFIAAICLEHDTPLLTLNQRHFSRVPGLSLLKPDDLFSI